VQGVLKDLRASRLSDGEKALFTFIEKLTSQAARIRQEDVDTLKEAGWNEEAIYDAVTVCSLFNFYNRWCDGTGVGELPPDGFKASGKRLAQYGYVTK
jgi:alkylhydroperoxidase family enzyme